MRKFLVVLLFLILGLVFFKPMLSNYAHLAMLRAYAAPMTYGERITHLRRAGQVACYLSGGPACDRASAQPDVSILQFVDDYYVALANPLYVITYTAQLPASAFELGGVSKANLGRPGQEAGETVTLFGAGYLEARTFFLSDAPGEWSISVQALHDAPPPVVLEIWVDEQCVGELVFGRGDQAWDTLALTQRISPGFHWLRIWYVNDYVERELGLDRNAYVRHVLITRREF